MLSAQFELWLVLVFLLNWVATHLEPSRISCWCFMHKSFLSNWTNIICLLHWRTWSWCSMFSGFWSICWSFASSDSFAWACLRMAGKNDFNSFTIYSWMSDRIKLSSCPGLNLLLSGIYCLSQYLKIWVVAEGYVKLCLETWKDLDIPLGTCPDLKFTPDFNFFTTL